MFTRKTYYETRSEILENLLEQAGDSSHSPCSSMKEVPKQWLPHWIGVFLKWVVLPFVLIDQAMQRVARLIIRPPFKRMGVCKRRGNCCYYILIQYSPSFIGRFFYFWYTQVHGFYLRFKDTHIYEGKRVYIMGCRNLKKDGSCKEYRLRPLICRQWPLVEHFGYPKILKGCGYFSSPPYPFDRPKDPS